MRVIVDPVRLQDYSSLFYYNHTDFDYNRAYSIAPNGNAHVAAHVGDTCITELATVYINGALTRTVCLESADPDLVLETRSRLHLDVYENVNYLLAIKRVIGMVPLPDGAFTCQC